MLFRSDAKGRLLVSEHSFGLKVLENGHFVNYSLADSSKFSVVWSIALNKDGRVFFGTQDEGLVVQSGNTFTSINNENGLCSNFIQSMFMERNAIWLGTDKGVNHIVLDGKNQVSDIRFYGIDEGLMSQEITQNGITQDENNCLWF